jgi:hypothetical protein
MRLTLLVAQCYATAAAQSLHCGGRGHNRWARKQQMGVGYHSRWARAQQMGADASGWAQVTWRLNQGLQRLSTRLLGARRSSTMQDRVVRQAAETGAGTPDHARAYRRHMRTLSTSREQRRYWQPAVAKVY